MSGMKWTLPKNKEDPKGTLVKHELTQTTDEHKGFSPKRK